MKNTLYLFSILFLLLSCSQSIKKNDLSKMNGYWEIEKVILSDGTTKDYKVNETIDFFDIKNDVGFRQKVTPQLDGSYRTNGIKEQLTITKEGPEYLINYKTNFDQWEETIVAIKDSVLVLKNSNKLEYHYRRTIPFSIK